MTLIHLGYSQVCTTSYDKTYSVDLWLGPTWFCFYLGTLTVRYGLSEYPWIEWKLTKAPKRPWFFSTLTF